MPGDLLSGGLIEIARDLCEKRVTARELIEAAIARHERFGERLHTYSLWAPEQARTVAAAADAAFAAGVAVGPLQGLPVSIKDLFAASGYPCFAGSSRRLPADPWERDGPVVAMLRRQLGVIMGKTHMSDVADADSHLRVNRRIVRNTVAVNYLGLCAITMPVGLDRAGMPVGLQLTAAAGAEERLLAVALAAERVLGTAADRLGTPPLLAS